MPLSWFRIPRATSEKLKRCRGNDKSDAKFEQCVDEIVSSHDGSAVAFRHVGRGRFSLVRIDWNERKKAAMVADLEATEIPDPEAEEGGDDRTGGISG